MNSIQLWLISLHSPPSGILQISDQFSISSYRWIFSLVRNFRKTLWAFSELSRYLFFEVAAKSSTYTIQVMGCREFADVSLILLSSPQPCRFGHSYVKVAGWVFSFSPCCIFDLWGQTGKVGKKLASRCTRCLVSAFGFAGVHECSCLRVSDRVYR